ARSTWFIRMTAVRDRLMAANQSVNWLPDNIREGRMGNFVENVIDWGLSRERYWGTPLPVWLCGDCGHIHVVGSIAELRAMGDDVPEDIELHKPYIDRVHLKCPECGGAMKRTPEVIDCWYDSGSMPFAQWHYPFENKEMFERNFPADFISEAIDQTRGWFYTLLAIGTLIFDRSPFENCLVLGHVQDKDGVKMSKHKGNVIDPWAVLDRQGADAVRWYFFSAGAPWLPSRFSPDMVSESQRKFMGTLWNTYAFFALYASIDGYDPAAASPAPEDLTLMDKWLLSKLNSLIDLVDRGLAEYKITETARAIAAFVDNLSNWYVRRCRERFWGKGMAGDKLAAFDTLYRALVALTGLCAPYVPFVAESMYQNLVRGVNPDAPESVHLTLFPTADLSRVDPRLEEGMEQVIGIVGLGRACRNLASIKVRQPLPALYVRGATLSDDMAALAADELNVKAVRFVQDARAFTTYRIKPQLRTLGPKYGKLIGRIGQALAAVDGNDAADAFARGEALHLVVDGTDVEVAQADALVEPMQKPGFFAQQERDLTVVLDGNLTDALVEEGFARELISKLQTMRKEAGFEVTDRIEATYRAGERLAAIAGRASDAIAAAVLAVSLTPGEPLAGGYTKEWDVNGEPATLSVRVKA
ncbi:MAG: class I tRNA ligase family protein, partial [Clostridiales bacterium]|nr:class I tRNA ligase family protein [Clostridiales bacterium]